MRVECLAVDWSLWPRQVVHSGAPSRACHPQPDDETLTGIGVSRLSRRMTSTTSTSGPFCSDDAPDQPRVTMRSPGEIVSAVPFLLGFAPTDSAVIIALQDKQIAMTARVDLADVPDKECIAAVRGAFLRIEATSALLIGYGDSRFATAPALTRLREALRGAGIAVLEQISVIGDRWFHERCAEELCCSPDGMPVADHDAAPSTLTLSAVTGGYRADRDAVIADCYPDRPLFVHAVRSELLLPEQEVDFALETIGSDLCAVLGWGTSEPPTAEQVARAALGCADPTLRDIWYAAVAPGILDGLMPERTDVHRQVVAAGQAAGDLGRDGILLDAEARDRVVQRVLTWVRNLPDDCPEVTVWALVVAAAAHLCAGDGARASGLAERAWALDVEPPGMLQTLTACLQHGFRPPTFGRLSQDSRGPRSRTA